MRKRFMAMAAAVLLGAVAALAGPAPAGAQAPSANDWFFPVNVKSGLAMSLLANEGLKGTHAVLWRQYRQHDQHWQWVPAGNGSFYLRNATTWRVLGIADGAKTDGAHAMIWDQNGNADQMWTPIDAGSRRMYLQNRNSGKCLGVAGGSTENGAHLMQWSCTRADQLWQWGS